MKNLFTLYVILIFTFSLSSFTCFAQNLTELWGMTYSGGNGGGVIFKTDGNGNNLQYMPFVIENPGQYPNSGLCQASNGKLYGMTMQGGANGDGVLFEYDPITNTYNKKLDFAGTTNGRSPLGSVMQASNGKLYGMTMYGGANDFGVLFEYDPITATYTKKLDFDWATNGSNPNGSLLQASNGKLYGMTSGGGANGGGTLFEYDPITATYTKKLDFDLETNGFSPNGSLLQASNGKLYGMTLGGGANNMGVLFEYDPATNNYTKKLDFAGATNGNYPCPSLIQASNGKLYGMTLIGGANDFGVLFEYDPTTATYTKKLDFAGTSNGSNPNGSLLQASNGKLYGMTSDGGANNGGILFEYNTSTNICTKKLDFEGTTNGRAPSGSLVQASNGKLYGITSMGGASDMGVLFEYDSAINTCTKNLDFDWATNGSNPNGSLLQASNGKLYGMTSAGGANNMGVIFEYDPITTTYTKKLDFDGTTNGSFPRGSLMEASNRKLYGMTSMGGANYYGVLFEYDPITATCTKKLDFDGTILGGGPYGTLMQASNGKLYGMTDHSLVHDYSVLFEYDPATSTCTKKLEFSGNSPRGSLLQASNGKLYGTASMGGANYLGVLFEYDPITATYTKKLDFERTTSGREPNGSLIEAYNRKLYGMTAYGGINDLGVLFEYDPITATYTKKLDFEGATNGSYPFGSLMQASNGKLYGMTSAGGTNNDGVLFEYDPTNGIYTKKLEFDGANGSYPSYSQLIEQPGISAGPYDATICPPESGTNFSIAAAGIGLSFQWQVDGGSGFTDIINSSIYSNATTKTLNITNVSITMNGYHFRCAITSTVPVFSIFSNTATLIINTIPASAGTISGNSTVCQGQNSLTYTVPAIANATSYIWTLPTGTSGTSTSNSIIVNYETSAVSGDIIVKGNSSCGDGAESVLPVVVNARPVRPVIYQNGIILNSDALNGNQWYDQNGLINGATNQNYTLTSNGNYYVIVTINGCSSESSNSINVVATGIDFTKDNKSIRVYPNPVSYELIIEIEGGTEKTEFEILNSSGQKVFKGFLFEKIVVPTTDFSPGVYIIKIENGKTFDFKKIVK